MGSSDAARPERLERLHAKVESELKLLGVTAIEDKLQTEVPETIRKLLQANIRVWMITGDKQETAINIAISCNLFHHTERRLLCNADSGDSAISLIKQLTERARRWLEAGVGLNAINTPRSVTEMERSGPRLGLPEFVIDGTTLGYVL